MNLIINDTTELEKQILELHKSKFGKIYRLFAENIPIVNTVYNDIITGIEKRNLLVFINALIDKKITNFINNKEVDENQWAILLQHATLKSLRCSKEGQIKQIVNILQGKCDGKIDSFNEAEDLINIISELSENEAIIMAKVYKKVMLGVNGIPNDYSLINKGELGVVNTYRFFSEETILKIIPNYNKSLRFYLERLKGKGLLQEKEIRTYNDLDKKSYRFTYMGIKLFKSLDFDYL